MIKESQDNRDSQADLESEGPGDRLAGEPSSPRGAEADRPATRRRRRKRRSGRGLAGRVRRAWQRQDLTAERFERVMDRLIEAVLVIMIVLSPLPLGSVAPWARSLLFALACLLVFLWVFKSSALGRIDIVRTPLWFFLLAYVALLIIQIIPLPAGVLSFLSPKTAELYARLIPGYPEMTGARPLSLNPHATVQEIYRMSTFFLVLFVFLNQVRHRWQVTVLLWALVALGAFESLYGLAERFSGSPHVFWVPSYDRFSVRGTYYNRNHFAGLMEMITPVVCAFLLALRVGRRESFRGSQLPTISRLLESFSKRGGYVFVLMAFLTGIMLLSGIFSLSRGGTVGLVVGFFLLFVFSSGGAKDKNQKIVLVLACVVLLALGAALYLGMGNLIDRFDQLTDDGSSSWSARSDLRQAGMQMIRDFPLLGTGGGTFADVFFPYQPLRFGDRVSHYLHCDWLQVPCETGAVGALILYAGGGIFLMSLFRKVRRRSDSFSRLVAVGAFAGTTAMLLHSFFDFNLYMVTANGLIFAVLLGICHTAVHMQGRARGSRASFSWWTFSVPEGAARLLIPGIVLLLCVVACIRPARIGLADLAFSRYLKWAEGEPDNYFFWKTPNLPLEEAKATLEAAARLDPHSPDIQFHLGFFQVKAQEETVKKIASDLARHVLAPSIPGTALNGVEESVQALASDITWKMTEGEVALDENSEEFQTLVAAFELPAKKKVADQTREVLRTVEPLFQRAVFLCPTVPWYHMDPAVAYDSLLPPGSVTIAERPSLDRRVQNALGLAPNRPSTLFLAGWHTAMQGLVDADQVDRLPSGVVDRVLVLFQKSLEGDPRNYAFQIYGFLQNQLGADASTLQRITHNTYLGQVMLLRYCLDQAMWAEAERAVDNILALVSTGTPAQGYQGLPLGADPSALNVAYSTERVRIIRRLGDADRWNEAKTQVAALFGPQCRMLRDQAIRFELLGRSAEAAKYCQDCLSVDPRNRAAMLSQMEIATSPNLMRSQGWVSDVLAKLFRFYREFPSLTEEECGRLSTVVARLAPTTPTEHINVQIVSALKALRCGQTEEAVNLLKALVIVEESMFRYWNQRHLLHFYLGTALEAAGKRDEAVAQYRQTLALAPSHAGSLARLAALGEVDMVLPPPVQEPMAPQPGSPEAVLASLQARGLLPGAAAGTPAVPPQPAEGSALSTDGNPSEQPLPGAILGGPEQILSEESSKALRAMVDVVVKEMASIDSQPPSTPTVETAGSQETTTVAQRLAALTPGRRWGIDFSDKLTLSGFDIQSGDASAPAPAGSPASADGSAPSGAQGQAAQASEGASVSSGPQGQAAQASEGASTSSGPQGQVGQAAAGSSPSSVGFVARYFWEIQADLDPREYWVRYLYIDADRNLGFMETRALLDVQAPDTVVRTLDGGIGTVLVQWHYVPLPQSAAREVMILIRKKLEGQGFAPPLDTGTSEKWLSLGVFPAGALTEHSGSVSPPSPSAAR